MEKVVMCDLLNFVCDEQSAGDVRDKLYDLMAGSVGLLPHKDRRSQLGAETWVVGTSGKTWHVMPCGDRWRFGITGAAIDALRGADVWWDYLEIAANVPRQYKITELHAAYDLYRPAHVFMHDVLKRFGTDGLRVGQRKKKIELTGWMHDAELGGWTGTMYVGRKTSIELCIYDKQHQFHKLNWGQPGEWLRLELRWDDPGGRFTVMDALDPTPLFWKYIPWELVPKPESVEEWEPGVAEFPRLKVDRPGSAGTRLYKQLERAIREAVESAERAGFPDPQHSVRHTVDRILKETDGKLVEE